MRASVRGCFFHTNFNGMGAEYLEFLRELFGGNALTYEQLEEAVNSKGFSVVNAADGAYVPKSDFDNLQTQIGTLSGQLEEANGKLEGYDPEWKTKAAEDRKALEKQQFDFALERAVSGAHPRNAKAVMALIDREKLKFSGGEVIGLEKQLNELQNGADTSFLFEPVSARKTGMSHEGGGEGTPDKKDEANAALRALFGKNGGN